ncbi:MAG: transcriptional regulator [Coriobacteriia bacterium]|nr:transcriptional regulator [Coriobacteriia bacterium]
MRFYRIGEKVVSRDKIADSIDAILTDREGGATQQEAADAHDVERTFISRLETLGEVRRGKRVALIAFPVANGEEIRRIADEHGIEFVMLMSQAEREGLESGRADQVFNLVLDTLAQLKDFDQVVVLASDWRVGTIEKILGREVIARNLGPSPLRHDVVVDPAELSDLLDAVIAPAPGKERTR